MWRPARFRPVALPSWTELGISPDQPQSSDLQSAYEAVLKAQATCQLGEVTNVRVVGYALIFLYQGSTTLGSTAVTQLRHWIFSEVPSTSASATYERQLFFPEEISAPPPQATDDRTGVERICEIGKFLTEHLLRVCESLSLSDTLQCNRA